MTTLPTPYQGNQDPGPDGAEDGRFERVERVVTLQAGAYWTAMRAVKDGSGLTIAEGTLLLLRSVRDVDGQAHTVILRHHPLDTRKQDHRFLVGDFLNAFEPEFEPQKARQREIDAVQGKVADLQKELVTGQNDDALLAQLCREAGVERPALLSPQEMNQVSSDSRALATQDRIDALRTQAERQKAVAEVKAKWIQSKTGEITGTLTKMAGFYEEQAVAALAQTEDVRRFAVRLTQGLETLSLYTGEGVTVEALCAGEDAAADEPLTLFQRKLYLDEEYLVNLGEGGADWKDLDGFAQALAADEAFLTRVLPTPRCVVTMGFRRREKSYVSDPQLNRLLNEKNAESFMLVRNGRAVHRIYSPLTSDKITRLFPTTDEANRPFRGYDGQAITVDDIRFTDAVEKSQAVQLHYKRLLILLWGLNDRLGLFGDFYNSATYKSFLSLEFQQERFRFVYDDERTLPSGRKPFRQWATDMNAHLRSGSRVLCVWRDLMTPETAPAAVQYYENGRYDTGVHRRYLPDTTHDVAVARTKGGELIVEVPVSGEVYDREKFEHRERRFNASVSLSAYKQHYGEYGYLCLDAVEPEDLDFYIHSREARQNYLAYIHCFIAARNAIAADRTHEAPIRAEAARALLDGGVVADEATAKDLVSAAVRAWRAAHRGAPLPGPADAEYRKAVTTLLDHAYALNGGGDGRVAEIEALLRAEGRIPLRLVATGRSKYVVYATPLEAEREDRLFPHAWAQRIQLEMRKTKISVTGRRWAVLPSPSPAAEAVLREWPEAEAWAKLRPQQDLSYEQVRAVLAEVESGAPRARLFAGPMDNATFAVHLEALVTLTDKLTGLAKQVRHPYLYAPLGVVIRQDRTPTPFVLAVCERAEFSLYRVATTTQRAAMENWAHRQYSRPDAVIGKWRDALSAQVALVPLERAAALTGDTLFHAEVGYTGSVSAIGPDPALPAVLGKFARYSFNGTIPEAWTVVALADTPLVAHNGSPTVQTGQKTEG